MVNYGIVYGLSAYGLADRLQIPQEEAQEFIDRYLERFPAVAQFMKDAVDAGRASTATCRRCSAAAARSPRSARATGRRASSASGSRSTRVIQGTAADIIKVAMVRCHDALRRRRA